MIRIKYKPKPLYLFLVTLPLLFWFYNPFTLYFLNDDAIHIPKSINLNFQYGASFRPLSDLSLYLDSKIYGLQAWGYHLTNFLFHILCTFAFYFFIKRCTYLWKVQEGDSISITATFFFFIYSFHSEAILWILGRGASIAGIFFVLSLFFFIKRNEKLIYHRISLFFFICGLFTYESVWILPVIVTLLACFSLEEKEWKKIAGEVAYYWIIFILYLIVRRFIEGSFIGTPYISDDFVRIDIYRYFYNYAALFLRSFVPPSDTRTFVLLAVVVFICVVFYFILRFRKKTLQHFTFFIWSSFLISLLPYIMLGIDTHDTESERYLYLPSIFFCIAIADAIYRVKLLAYRRILIVLFSLFHLYFLFQSAASFKHSSLIAKKTIQTLNQSNLNLNTIYLVDVPAQYKGAYIFRVDFEYFLKWLVPQVKYQNVITISSREIAEKKDFIGSNLSLKENLPYGLRIPFSLNENKEDAILLWTDSSFFLFHNNNLKKD